MCFLLALDMSKSFRYCSEGNCRQRLSDQEKDGHLRCVSCIGFECNLESKCNECILWPDKQFETYIKHRDSLKKARARKAKHRLLKKEGSLLTSDNAMAGNQTTTDVNKGKIHEISPSVSSNSNSVVDQSVMNLEGANYSDISAYSPSSFPKFLPSTPILPAPANDQGITRAEFSNLMSGLSSLTAQMTSLTETVKVLDDDRKRRLVSSVHSVNVPHPLQDSSMNAASDVIVHPSKSDQDPQFPHLSLSLVEGKVGTVGESALAAVNLCPYSSPGIDRSRKREKVKTLILVSRDLVILIGKAFSLPPP